MADSIALFLERACLTEGKKHRIAVSIYNIRVIDYKSGLNNIF